MVGFCASLFALLCGMWAALSLRQYGAKLQKYLGLMFYLPAPSHPFLWVWAFWWPSARDRCR
jgi:2-aminoethylphosphonate transport system permease protein